MTRKTLIGLLFTALVIGGTALSFTYLSVNQAEASACAQACYNRHAQCRIATKGSPRCDAQLRQCLKGCLRRN